ncbi:hypothetical protein KHQ06_06615 [Nocardia tengchongensis]|uniref:Uncharacterized protein n=1 Tax=Nocardia tengchongensis TaxID=2055889 RepID=A0ABX8CRY9_9NOCA|nr:hypothetical protein [Nocardia tengchongensis]QVI22685.1 hypothetical protein KHQ06_06615 [Nocardia tengchongensis]
MLEQMYLPPDQGGLPQQGPAPTTLAELALPGVDPKDYPRSPTAAALDQIVGAITSAEPGSAVDSGPKSLFPGILVQNPVGVPKTTDIQVTASCVLPVPSTPGAVPVSISSPNTRFRTNLEYTPQQLADDLAILKAGPTPWVGPGSPYDVAQQRLEAARYTIIEQRNDLERAFFEPRNDDERALQQAAFRRLHDAGIQWNDPAVERFLRDDKTQFLSDPTKPARYTAPPKYTPAEIRQQILEANRPDVDFRTAAGSFLVDMTIGPAIVLWDAAHDRGDHSGWEIAGAAAQLGLNVLMLPGVGGAAAAGARAGLRAVAPELMASLKASDSALDALRISREFQGQQLAKEVEAFGQHSEIPQSHVSAPNPTESGVSNLHPDAVPQPARSTPRRAESVAAQDAGTVPDTVPYADAAARSSVAQEVSIVLEDIPVLTQGTHPLLDVPTDLTAIPRFSPLRLADPAEFSHWAVGRTAGDEAVALYSPGDLRVAGTQLVPDAQMALARASYDDLRAVQAMLDVQGEDVAGLLNQYGIKGRKSVPGFSGVDDVVSRLNESLVNLAEVRQRGFPYLFDSKAHFEETKVAVLEAAGMRGINPDDVELLVQGSSVHKPLAGDVDIALVVSAAKFDEYSLQFLRYATKDNAKKSILKEIPKGKLAYNRWMPRSGGDNIGAIIHETLLGGQKIQISLMKEGGEYLVAPYLR